MLRRIRFACKLRLMTFGLPRDSREDFINPAFFGTLHETGHGLHGRGFGPEIDGGVLSDMESYSHAVCESQSRTWENLVGRSREFWAWAFPIAREIFPEQFAGSSPEAVYRAVNRVRRQFIRVEADELTYNLHIMLRFELGRALVHGELSVNEAAEAWRATFEQYFGVAPPDDRVGVLQDIHWSMGGIGAFVGYALGNLLSSQFYDAALRAHPQIPDQIAMGNFDLVRDWLTDNIYRHGRKYTADELTRRITGEPMQSRSYMRYLEAKLTGLYGL